MNSNATVEDFIFTGIKLPGNFTNTGFTSKPVNANVFPGLNTLGLSLVRADFGVGGVNVPHYHPRATEIAGMLHFQMNVGESPAAILGSFDSQNPGLMKIPSTIFGSDINEELLEKAFGLSSKDLRKLKKKFSSS
uniref:Cupin type-1 domain-containing protein n=1 Tax=Chenopodium quinoa TaxID=63459 RepID=A0A803N715_CHEQI